MKKRNSIHWIISIFVFTSVFITFFYTDLTSLTIWSTNIWDCIFGDGIKNYYLYSSLNLNQIEHSIVGNDLLIYIPWAIWNFPIWLIAKATGITISTNVFMLLYSKLFLVVVFAGVLYLTRQICKVLEMKNEDIQQVLYLASSSVFMVTSIAYAGQNDIFPIFFFMVGLLYLLKGKQVPFLLFAAISIAMKPYMIFSFLILIVLTEKKIWKIVAKITAGCSVFVIQKIVLRNFLYYQEAMNSGAADGEITVLLKTKIPIAQYEVSVLVLLLGILSVLAYLSKPTKENLGKYIIYYATSPLIILFTVSGYSFYRLIYLVPLLYVMFVLNKKIPIYFQLFLELSFVTCVYYQFLRMESLFYNPHYIIGGSIGKGFSFCEVLMRRKPNLGYFFSISAAIIIVVALLILIINHPKFSKKLELEVWEHTHYISYIRAIFIVVIIVVAMSGFIVGR